MSEHRGEFLETLIGQTSKIKRRRDIEMQTVSHKDQQYMKARKTPPEDVRSEQVNFRVSPRFKQHLRALAIELDISATEVLYKALYELRARVKG